MTDKNRTRAIIFVVVAIAATLGALAGVFLTPGGATAQIIKDQGSIAGFTVELANSFQDPTWQEVEGGGYLANYDTGSTGQDLFQSVQLTRTEVTPIELTGPAVNGLSGNPGARSNLFQVQVSPSQMNETASRVRRIDIDSLEFAEIGLQNEVSLGRDFEPGGLLRDVEVTFDVSASPQTSNELLDWWQEVASGSQDLRNFSVSYVIGSGTVLRTYTFHDARLVSYSPFTQLSSSGSHLLTERFTIRSADVEMQAPTQYVTGAHRAAMSDIQDILNGQHQQQDLTIRLLSNQGDVTREFIYSDVFVLKYEFPEFDASSTDSPVETVTFRADGLLVQ